MDREFSEAGIASTLELGLGEEILTAQMPTLRLHQLEDGPLGFELEFEVSPADWLRIEAVQAFHLDSGERGPSFGQGFAAAVTAEAGAGRDGGAEIGIVLARPVDAPFGGIGDRKSVV